MEIRFITTEKVSETPKKINEYMGDLKGKIQFILENKYLIKLLNLK